MTLEQLSSDETKSSGTTDEMQQWYSEHARAHCSTVQTFDQFGAPESQQHFSRSYSDQYYHTDPTTTTAQTGYNTTDEVSIESVSGAIDLMKDYSNMASHSKNRIQSKECGRICGQVLMGWND